MIEETSITVKDLFYYLELCTKMNDKKNWKFTKEKSIIITDLDENGPSRITIKQDNHLYQTSTEMTKYFKKLKLSHDETISKMLRLYMIQEYLIKNKSKLEKKKYIQFKNDMVGLDEKFFKKLCECKNLKEIEIWNQLFIIKGYEKWIK